jgi:hypothetical protein
LARQGKHQDAIHAAEEILKHPSPTANNMVKAAAVYASSVAAIKKDLNVPEPERTKIIDHYSSRALELLTNARDAGYFKGLTTNDSRITDKDLNGIRDCKEFQEMMKQLVEGK